MARQDHGDALTSVQLQPGSQFTRSEWGFDRGTRTFVIDSGSYAAADFARGDADTDLVGSGYSTMFIDRHTPDFRKNGLCYVTVEYLGLITGTTRADVIANDGGQRTELQVGRYVSATNGSVTYTPIQQHQYPYNKRTLEIVEVVASRPASSTLDTVPSLTKPTVSIASLYDDKAAVADGENVVVFYLSIAFSWKVTNSAIRDCGTLFEITRTVEYSADIPSPDSTLSYRVL